MLNVYTPFSDALVQLTFATPEASGVMFNHAGFVDIVWPSFLKSVIDQVAVFSSLVPSLYVVLALNPGSNWVPAIPAVPVCVYNPVPSTSWIASTVASSITKL